MVVIVLDTTLCDMQWNLSNPTDQGTRDNKFLMDLQTLEYLIY
jgi:hypothetical protein